MKKIMLTGDRPTGKLHVGPLRGVAQTPGRASEYRRF